PKLFTRTYYILSLLAKKLSLATLAVNTGAGRTTLAVSLRLGSCWGIDYTIQVALLGLNNIDTVAVSLLHALALVNAVAVAAGRHG
ncbi:hypothetical protein, partial [Acinetobacter baumannii]|uniref:hypothetical protein n=1 Tax=Acinetobacter baumannii TaxID=470 RepID=UPI003395B942